MSKRILFFSILFILAAILTGCQKINFSVTVNKDQNAEITAKNASKGSFGAAGSLETAEGQKIFIDAALDKGEIMIKFIPFDLGMDAAANELKNAVKGEDAVLELTVSGNEKQEYDIEPGSYMVSAEALSKSSGNILISVQ